MIELLKKKGISVNAFAKELGVSQQNAEYIVKRRKFNPTIELLNKIAFILECNVDDILSNE